MKTLNRPVADQIEIIQWPEDSVGTMLWKFPGNKMQIKYASKLTVRQGQYAFIVYNDTVADVYKPGLYTLTVDNMPRFSILNHWDEKFQGPFEAKFYFFKTKFFIDQHWSLTKPATIKDPEFGLIRAGLSGKADLRIIDAEQLLTKQTKTQTEFNTSEATALLENLVRVKLPEMAKRNNLSVIHPADDELCDLLQQEINETLEIEYGLQISNFKLKAKALGADN
jgi:membrane protease subunit (stomatin/prohibitin family)